MSQRDTEAASAYSPTAGLGFDDREFESRIVWIWGGPRSGSTWLLHLLTHPIKLNWWSDPEDVLGFLVPRTWQKPVDVIPVDTTFVANHLLPLTSAGDYADDLAPLTFSSAALGLRGRPNYFFSSKYEDAWLPELRRMMLVRFHRLLERAAERHDLDSPLIVLKEVSGAHGAPLVMSMFPRSKLLFLVRDGRDMVDSQTAANQPGTWLPGSKWTTPVERLEFIRTRAHGWVGDMASIERAFDAHPTELRKMVRYEDLLAAPAENVGSLVEWLGLRRDDQWLQWSVEANSFDSIAADQKGPKKFFRSASPGAWRKNMTDEEATTLESVLSDKLRELGYRDSARDAG